ncbi:MAG: translation factor Sua5 [Bacteroides sp. SM23_62_1]|nr:MAG: translation factor Sua5 [Bacteroides sp. SM23_62_1]
MERDIARSLEVLKEGGLILYPTDTIWGIGCDATDYDAVRKILNLKKRTDMKSLLVLLDDEGKLHHYVNTIPDIAWDIRKVTDRPLTIIYPQGKNLASNLLHKDGSVGIRIVLDDFCRILISRFGKPLVSTSANISGESSPSNYREISETIKSGVDYIVQWRQEETFKAIPSGIIKLGEKGEVEIIRK